MPVLKGFSLNPQQPEEMEFYLDTKNNAVKEKEINRLIKYFLGFLTIPQKKLWVNLSPYEPDRVIEQELAQLDAGKDLLLEDYLLKQLTASLTNPKTPQGKKFWQKVYAAAEQIAGTTKVPINTNYKVWIVADVAEVYEYQNNFVGEGPCAIPIQNQNKINTGQPPVAVPTIGQNKTIAFVKEASLKVMMEEDYHNNLKINNNVKQPGKGLISPVPDRHILRTQGTASAKIQGINNAAKDIFKQELLPIIEEQVNTSITFAPLRQIYYSLILATYLKETYAKHFLFKHYINQEKTQPISLNNHRVKETIYQSYLNNFMQGAYKVVTQRVGAGSKPAIKRSYFSGGMDCRVPLKVMRFHSTGEFLIGIKETSKFWRVVKTVLFPGASVKSPVWQFPFNKELVLKREPVARWHPFELLHRQLKVSSRISLLASQASTDEIFQRYHKAIEKYEDLAAYYQETQQYEKEALVHIKIARCYQQLALEEVINLSSIKQHLKAYQELIKFYKYRQQNKKAEMIEMLLNDEQFTDLKGKDFSDVWFGKFAYPFAQAYPLSFDALEESFAVYEMAGKNFFNRSARVQGYQEIFNLAALIYQGQTTSEVKEQAFSILVKAAQALKTQGLLSRRDYQEVSETFLFALSDSQERVRALALENLRAFKVKDKEIIKFLYSQEGVALQSNSWQVRGFAIDLLSQYRLTQAEKTKIEVVLDKVVRQAWQLNGSTSFDSASVLEGVANLYLKWDKLRDAREAYLCAGIMYAKVTKWPEAKEMFTRVNQKSVSLPEYTLLNYEKQSLEETNQIILECQESLPEIAFLTQAFAEMLAIFDCSKDFIKMQALLFRKAGEEFFKQGDFTRARDLLCRASQVFEDDLGLQQLIGDCCYKIKYYSQAEDAYSRALELSPGEEKEKLNRKLILTRRQVLLQKTDRAFKQAEVYQKQGQILLAVNSYLISAQDSHALANLLSDVPDSQKEFLQQASNRYFTAARQLVDYLKLVKGKKEKTEIAGRIVGCCRNSARICLQLREYVRAQNAYKFALKYASLQEKPYLYADLARVLLESRHERSLEESVEFYLRSGQSFLNQGNYAQAKEQFTQVLEINPNCSNPILYVNLAEVYQRMQSLPQALDNCTQAIRIYSSLADRVEEELKSLELSAPEGHLVESFEQAINVLRKSADIYRRLSRQSFGNTYQMQWDVSDKLLNQLYSLISTRRSLVDRLEGTEQLRCVQRVMQMLEELKGVLRKGTGLYYQVFQKIVQVQLSIASLSKVETSLLGKGESLLREFSQVVHPESNKNFIAAKEASAQLALGISQQYKGAVRGLTLRQSREKAFEYFAQAVSLSPESINLILPLGLMERIYSLLHDQLGLDCTQPCFLDLGKDLYLCYVGDLSLEERQELQANFARKLVNYVATYNFTLSIDVLEEFDDLGILSYQGLYELAQSYDFRQVVVDFLFADDSFSAQAWIEFVLGKIEHPLVEPITLATLTDQRMLLEIMRVDSQFLSDAQNRLLNKALQDLNIEQFLSLSLAGLDKKSWQEQRQEIERVYSLGQQLECLPRINFWFIEQANIDIRKSWCFYLFGRYLDGEGVTQDFLATTISRFMPQDYPWLIDFLDSLPSSAQLTAKEKVLGRVFKKKVRQPVDIRMEISGQVRVISTNQFERVSKLREILDRQFKEYVEQVTDDSFFENKEEFFTIIYRLAARKNYTDFVLIRFFQKQKNDASLLESWFIFLLKQPLDKAGMPLILNTTLGKMETDGLGFLVSLHLALISRIGSSMQLQGRNVEINSVQASSINRTLTKFFNKNDLATLIVGANQNNLVPHLSAFYQLAQQNDSLRGKIVEGFASAIVFAAWAGFLLEKYSGQQAKDLFAETVMKFSDNFYQQERVSDVSKQGLRFLGGIYSLSANLGQGIFNVVSRGVRPQGLTDADLRKINSLMASNWFVQIPQIKNKTSDLEKVYYLTFLPFKGERLISGLAKKGFRQGWVNFILSHEIEKETPKVLSLSFKIFGKDIANYLLSLQRYFVYNFTQDLNITNRGDRVSLNHFCEKFRSQEWQAVVPAPVRAQMQSVVEGFKAVVPEMRQEIMKTIAFVMRDFVQDGVFLRTPQGGYSSVHDAWCTQKILGQSFSAPAVPRSDTGRKFFSFNFSLPKLILHQKGGVSFTSLSLKKNKKNFSLSPMQKQYRAFIQAMQKQGLDFLVEEVLPFKLQE